VKEQDIQNSIIEYIRIIGGYTQRINSGKVVILQGEIRRVVNLADAGTPDILGWYDGKPFGIEVKKNQKIKDQWIRTVSKYELTGGFAKSNRRIRDQYFESEKIRRAGGKWGLVCSLSEAIEFFEQQLGAPKT
jgi:hypothetical protein